MSQEMVLPQKMIRMEKSRIYKTMAFLGSAAIVACAAIIVYFNLALTSDSVAGLASTADIAIITLMPYMISGVIAALTAIAVMAMLPTTRYVEPSIRMVGMLRSVAEGNLTQRLRLATDDPLRDVANELNSALDHLDTNITAWKIQDRIQWGALCRIRMAAELGDCDDVLHFCDEMEKNWDRIAEIENSLTT